MCHLQKDRQKIWLFHGCVPAHQCPLGGLGVLTADSLHPLSIKPNLNYWFISLELTETL